ncbi:velvet factor-domain-containing protein [Circinella umbellata]|nr:velvet factor-domain-containing protein [Circinella umbellata]
MSTLQTRSHYEITERNRIQLVVRQQPVKARLCSFKEKVDRRPVDPPPIVQLIDRDNDPSYLQNPYFFLYATLATTTGDDLHFSNNTRTTAGSVVQSLHKLKDVDNRDGGFFIFADISVRHEGFFKLKFTLFKIEQSHVFRICSIFSDPFQVYSPKTFPGMSESTFLTRCFSDQGVRIRIRKETRASGPTKRRKTEDDHDGDRDPVSPFIVHDPSEGSSSSRFRLPVNQAEPATPIPYLQHHQTQHHTALPSSTSSLPMLHPPPLTALPLTTTSSSPSSTADVSYSMHAMSMQNLLLSPQQQQQQKQQHSDSNYRYITTTATTTTIPTTTTSMMTDEPQTVAEGAPPPTSQSLFTQSLQLPPIVRRSTIQQATISNPSPSFLPSTSAATLEPSSSTGSTSSSSNPSIQPSSVPDDYFIHTSNNNASSTTSITEGSWFSHHHHHPQHHPQYQYHHHNHHNHHSNKDGGSSS